MKPAYRIPSLTEIRSVPSNGRTAVSTFSGAGGGSLGLRWAGFSIPYASEFIPAAAETYAANFPTTTLDTRDIREVDGDEIRSTCGDLELDLLEGSPPCASFSLSGSRQRSWGEVKSYSDGEQRVDDLFFEFARLVESLQPRAFLAENVPGLAAGVAAGYLSEIVAALRSAGYTVFGSKTDAQWLGVPQRRNRLLLVGFRRDLRVAQFEWPDPMSYRYSIAEALEDLPEATGDERAPAGADQAIWREWDRLRPGQQSRRYFNLIRPDPHRPCPTITQTAALSSAASVTHYAERRKFHASELRRLCGFPDDFILTGNYQKRAERLGRAVAPPVYRAVGARIAETLEQRGV